VEEKSTEDIVDDVIPRLEIAQIRLSDIKEMLSDTGDLADPRWAAGLTVTILAIKRQVQDSIDLIRTL
jgi:hypothetical protein